MQRTILITSGIIAAFLAGVVFEGYTPYGVTRAFNSATDTVQVAPAPVTHYATRRVANPPQTVVYSQSEQPRAQTRRRRSWEREALIVAGSSGAGAAIGAAAGGGKGAGIGAVSGAVAGLVYDMATRDK